MTAVLLDPPKDPPGWPGPWRPTHIPHHPACVLNDGPGGVDCTPCDIADDQRHVRADDN